MFGKIYEAMHMFILHTIFTIIPTIDNVSHRLNSMAKNILTCSFNCYVVRKVEFILLEEWQYSLECVDQP